MAERPAASRELLQATYTPVKIEQPENGKPKDPGRHQDPDKPTDHSGPQPEKEDQNSGRGRAWQKYSFVARLRATGGEAQEVKARLLAGSEGAQSNLQKEALAILDVLGPVLDDMASPSGVQRVAMFHDFSAAALAMIARELLCVRQEEYAKIKKHLEGLIPHAKGEAEPPPEEAEPTRPPEGWKPLALHGAVREQGRAFEQEEKRDLGRAKKGKPGDGVPGTRGQTVTRSAVLIKNPSSSRQPVERPEESRPSIRTVLLQRPHDTGTNGPATREVVSFFRKAGITEECTATEALMLYAAWIEKTGESISAFEGQMQVEPIGFLHLEKLRFTPAGIERGGLSYSVPLAPGEEVNIAHKEWSNTTEEFERIATDFQEDYSEEGVAEKSELAQSASSEKQHALGFNTAVTASGKYGPVSVTATAGFNVSSSASQSEERSRSHSASVTSKASSRTKKEHKMSFKVASAAGEEDHAVRKIVNHDLTNAKRADYYQLIRKWCVTLYRYGLRLTYDLTIPEPGSDILSKIVEVKRLDELLESEYSFALHPDSINRYNYPTLASQYGASVESPPAQTQHQTEADSKEWANKDAAKKGRHHVLLFQVPEEYEVVGVSYSSSYWYYEDEDWDFEILTNMGGLFGRSGKLVVGISTKYIASYYLEVNLTLGLRSHAERAWKMRVWEALREAAEQQHLQYRQMLKEKRARLTEELGAEDALTLRKIEREEVMKGVLRWMFGPSFDLLPQDLPADLYASDGSVASEIIWHRVMSFGEFIKFLHHAIEWENMIYFLYPYFWSHQSRWELKKYLSHPDPQHRAFLKAGCARVVLTIRPGFERDFLSLVETGEFDSLATDHPYFTIADEIRAFAETNYPAIPSANTDTDARPLLTPSQKECWQRMKRVIVLLEQFHADQDRYPTDAEGLAALGPYAVADGGSLPVDDPWGHRLVYRCPGALRDYDLVSLGADGEPGGSDEDADITNWASSCLIGKWYEHTPTSALDIAFGETMPEA